MRTAGSALVLTQVLGLSYADAAQVCGCALGTIRSRVARAREDLLALRSLGDRRPRAWALGESSPPNRARRGSTREAENMPDRTSRANLAKRSPKDWRSEGGGRTDDETQAPP